jgi:amino acid transporter
MNAAAQGEDEEVGKDTEITRDYRRRGKQYPYRSHGQWMRATYGLTATLILAFFNGWRCFISPFSSNDFVASYISVSELKTYFVSLT